MPAYVGKEIVDAQKTKGVAQGVGARAARKTQRPRRLFAHNRGERAA
jgi:hypothetical protein